MSLLFLDESCSAPLFWDVPDLLEGEDATSRWWDAPPPVELHEDPLLGSGEDPLLGSGEGPVRWSTPGVTGLGVHAGQGLVSETVPVSPLIACLRDAVRAVREQELASQPAAQALADARAVLQAGLDLRLAGLGRLADVDRRSLHDLDGAASTSSWVARLDLDLPRGDVALARRLERLPHVRAALDARRISLGAARVLQPALATASRFLDRPGGLVDGQPQEAVLQAVIVDGVRQLVLQAIGGVPDLLGPDGGRKHDPRVLDLVDALQAIADSARSGAERLEQGLLVLADHVPAVALPGAVGLLMDALLPQQLDERADRAHRERGLSLTRNPDGSGWHLRGDLDLLAGERLFVLLTAEAARDLRNPDDTRAAEQLRAQGLDPHDPAHQDRVAPEGLGEALTTSGAATDLREVAAGVRDCAVPRSRRQRLHDAFSGLLGRALDHGLAGTAGKASVHLQVTVGLDALQGEPGSMPAVGSSGTGLPRTLVERLACDSRVTRLLFSLGGKQLQHSHTGRTATASERAAKAFETGRRCQAAGCSRGPDVLTQTEVHHATPWADTGVTRHDDSVWLCTTSHGQLHHGHVLQLTDGRWLGPNGWTVPPAPPPLWPDDPPF